MLFLTTSVRRVHKQKKSLSLIREKMSSKKVVAYYMDDEIGNYVDCSNTNGCLLYTSDAADE